MAASVWQAGLEGSAQQKIVLSCSTGISKWLQSSSDQVVHVQHLEGFILRKEASWPSAASVTVGSSYCHTSILTSRRKLGLLNFGVLNWTSQPSFTSLLYLELYNFSEKTCQKIKQVFWKNPPKIICIWKKISNLSWRICCFRRKKFPGCTGALQLHVLGAWVYNLWSIIIL